MDLFIDSDVIIASLLSSAGASHTLLHATKDVRLIISDKSLQELTIVIKRLGIPQEKLDRLTHGEFQIVEIKRDLDEIKRQFDSYVTDPDDTHIVAGAVEAHVRFLITYNVKHFKVEMIKQKYHIIILTPGRFLQYLRSLQ